jgi:N-acetylglucosamine kinase
MSIEYVFGVDGGQTSVKCVLVTTDGRVMSHGAGGGLIHLAAQGSGERFLQAMGDAFASAWVAAGIAPQPVAAVGLGLTGVEANTPEARAAKALLAQVIEARCVEIHSDAYIALIGAHGGLPGIIAIAGTGSHVMGINATGQTARAGGWGWLLGDEGSAMWIGRSGLIAAMHALDGVGPPTLLEQLMNDHFKLASLRDVKRVAYDTSFGSQGFASLAKVVSYAAERQDEVASNLIAQAGDDLAAQVMAVQRRLDLPRDAQIAPVGGAFEHVHNLREAFVQSLRRENTLANVVAPQQPPIIGAAMLALRLCRSNIQPTLE